MLVECRAHGKSEIRPSTNLDVVVTYPLDVESGGRLPFKLKL